MRDLVLVLPLTVFWFLAFAVSSSTTAVGAARTVRLCAAPTLPVSVSVSVSLSADADACVPYLDNEDWTRGMGYPVKSEWHPWMYMDQ